MEEIPTYGRLPQILAYRSQDIVESPSKMARQFQKMGKHKKPENQPARSYLSKFWVILPNIGKFYHILNFALLYFEAGLSIFRVTCHILRNSSIFWKKSPQIWHDFAETGDGSSKFWSRILSLPSFFWIRCFFQAENNENTCHRSYKTSGHFVSLLDAAGHCVILQFLCQRNKQCVQWIAIATHK